MSGFAPGDLIAHYRVTRSVGVGGMGRVMAAHDERLDRDVAIKVLVGHGVHNRDFLARFAREAAVLAQIDHPHVIPIFDHGNHAGMPYIVTPLAAGGDLGGALRERGHLPLATALGICRHVAEALHAAHRAGVVHRDVKPANVLLRDAGSDRPHVWLCDFGVARIESSELTTAGALTGTWNYLAPELAHGAPASTASDIYATGCLLWECLTGQPPYPGVDVDVAMQHQTAPVPQLASADPPTVATNRILQRALAKAPHERYASAAELARDLEAVERLAATGKAPRRRGRLLAGVGGATALALVGASAFLWWPRGGEQPPPPPGEPVTVTATPTTPGDLDGDGFGDFAVVDFTEGAVVLSSDGTGFASRVEQPAWQPDAIVGDVEGDGVPDVVVVKDVNNLVRATVYTKGRRGPSTLVLVKEGTIGLNARALLGDVDADGHDDLILIAIDTDTASARVALGNGDGTFADSTQWATGLPIVGQFLIGDVDRDGREDLVSVFRGNTGTAQFLHVYRSTGSGFAQIDDTRPALAFGNFNRLGDVDGDGHLELVSLEVSTANAILGVMVRRFDPSTQLWAEPERWYPAHGQADSFVTDIALSDVDGDGLADLVMVSAGRITTFRSTGTAFEPADAFSGANLPTGPNGVFSVVAPETR